MKKEVNFREMLKKRQEKTKSLVCVGLDPLPEKLPDCMKTESPYSAHLATDIAMWMMRIVDATAPYTSMYKPQRAHWEAIPGGVIALQMVISYIELMYPDIVVFTDCKRGDIGRTQERYKVAQFDIDGTQGMNFSPYMGKDCMQFLVDQENIARALVSLCYTSNESARLTQDQIMADGHPYWEFIATTTLKWAEELGIAENAGLVMAAAYEFPKKSGQVYSRHLSRCRELVGDKLWFLIPGVGTQGGFIKETVKSAFAGYGSIAINSSSDIIFASAGEDFAEAAGEKAKQLYLAIADALEIDRAGLVPQSLIVSGDPLATLKNCGGYYESPKDKDGKFLGPVVAYAGTYDTSSGPKNKVGFVYYDFAFVEDKPIPRDYFAALIAAEVEKTGLLCHVVVGAPMGGILLAGDVAEHLKCRSIFAEKQVTELANPGEGIKEKSQPIINRHQIYPEENVIVVEDVCNNFSTSEKMRALITAKGGKVVAIVCGFNRSGVDEWEGIPVLSACFIPTEQFEQGDSAVAELIAEGAICWKPKAEFEELKKRMTT